MVDRVDETTGKRKPGWQKPGPGRPSVKTPDLCEEICERIAEGEPLAEICRDERMPCVTTVWAWEKADTAFSKSIADARLAGFDRIAAEALRISDTPCEGTITTVTSDGTTTVRTEDALGHRKLQVDTRLKLLAKWDPRRYGERTILQGDSEADPVSVHLYIPDNGRTVA